MQESQRGRKGGEGEEEKGRRWGGDGEGAYTEENFHAKKPCGVVCMGRVSLCYSIGRTPRQRQNRRGVLLVSSEGGTAGVTCRGDRGGNLW